MFDNRNSSCRSCSACNICNTNSCVAFVIWALTALFFFVVGAIAGAYASDFVTGAVVPIAILAIVLFLAIVFIWLTVCRRNCRG